MGKRLIILSALVLFLASASAQQDTLKYRISLRDKAATVYSLEHPVGESHCKTSKTEPVG